MKRQRLIMAILLFATVGFAGQSCADTLFKTLGIIEPSVRLEAPAFSLTSLDGKELGLEEFRGKLVLLNFWATFCAPCREEMPSMERLWQRFKEKGLVIVAINVDRGGADRVKKFVEEVGVTFPVLFDPEGRVRRNYEIFALPTSYIIGRDGRFLGKIVGERRWDEPEFTELFERLLSR